MKAERKPKQVRTTPRTDDIQTRRWQQQKWERRPFTAETIGRMYAVANRLTWPAKRSAGVTKATMWRAFLVALYFLSATVGSLLVLKWSDIGNGKVTLKGKSHPLHPTLARHLHAIRDASSSELVFGLESQQKHGIWKGLAAVARMVGCDPSKVTVLVQTLAQAEWRDAQTEAGERLQREGGAVKVQKPRARRNELALTQVRYPAEFDGEPRSSKWE
jgi:hypothetical protein